MGLATRLFCAVDLRMLEYNSPKMAEPKLMLNNNNYHIICAFQIQGTNLSVDIDHGKYDICMLLQNILIGSICSIYTRSREG